ncbi:MAG: hypothetical protein ACYDAN_10125 [Candidatus Limnocylindrales bacterium]
MTASGMPGVLGHGGGARRLGQGLIAYGMVGLVVAIIGFGAMVWVNGRISTLRADAEASVAQAATTMELAAIVLRGATTTAQSFSGTVEQTRQGVAAAVVTVTEARADLSALEAQLRSVSILGATPLASSADAVGRIAASMGGIESQIPVVADSLTGNRDALARNAAALSALADSTAALAARLGSGGGRDAFGDVQPVIAITLLMFAAWSCVPAVGAIGLGVWLRGELARSRSS